MERKGLIEAGNKIIFEYNNIPQGEEQLREIQKMRNVVKTPDLHSLLTTILFACIEQSLTTHNIQLLLNIFKLYEEVEEKEILSAICPNEKNQKGVRTLLMKIANHWFYQKYSLKRMVNYTTDKNYQPFYILASLFALFIWKKAEERYNAPGQSEPISYEDFLLRIILLVHEYVHYSIQLNICSTAPYRLHQIQTQRREEDEGHLNFLSYENKWFILYTFDYEQVLLNQKELVQNMPQKASISEFTELLLKLFVLSTEIVSHFSKREEEELREIIKELYIFGLRNHKNGGIKHIIKAVFQGLVTTDVNEERGDCGNILTILLKLAGNGAMCQLRTEENIASKMNICRLCKEPCNFLTNKLLLLHPESSSGLPHSCCQNCLQKSLRGQIDIRVELNEKIRLICPHRDCKVSLSYHLDRFINSIYQIQIQRAPVRVEFQFPKKLLFTPKPPAAPTQVPTTRLVKELNNDQIVMKDEEIKNEIFISNGSGRNGFHEENKLITYANKKCIGPCEGEFKIEEIHSLITCTHLICHNCLYEHLTELASRPNTLMKHMVCPSPECHERIDNLDLCNVLGDEIFYLLSDRTMNHGYRDKIISIPLENVENPQQNPKCFIF